MTHERPRPDLPIIYWCTYSSFSHVSVEYFQAHPRLLWKITLKLKKENNSVIANDWGQIVQPGQWDDRKPDTSQAGWITQNRCCHTWSGWQCLSRCQRNEPADTPNPREAARKLFPHLPAPYILPWLTVVQTGPSMFVHFITFSDPPCWCCLMWLVIKQDFTMSHLAL